MKIDKNSWHFRLFQVYTLGDAPYCHWRPAISLCSYVRGIMRGLVMACLVILAVTLIALILFVEPIGTLLMYFLHGTFHGGFIVFSIHNNWFGSIMIVSIAVYLFVLMVALFAIWDLKLKGKLVGYLQRREAAFSQRAEIESSKSAKPVEKGASIFRILADFFKATHDKICPFIEVIEEEEKK